MQTQPLTKKPSCPCLTTLTANIMMMPLSGAWAFSSKLLQILKKVNLIVDQEQICMLIGEISYKLVVR